jgi:hypothetical protein
MQTPSKRERLRLASLSFRPLPEGGRLIVVELEWGESIFRGQAVGTGTLEGDLRASGEAAAKAAQAATGDRVSMSLLGIKAVRAFDGRVIIAAVEVRAGGRPLKLLGAQPLTEGDLPPAGVLTVLGAVNRVIAPYLPGVEKTADSALEGPPMGPGAERGGDPELPAG